MSGSMYRAKMRLAHRFGFCWPQHTPIEGPDSGLVWCRWCGMRGRKPGASDPANLNGWKVGDRLTHTGYPHEVFTIERLTPGLLHVSSLGRSQWLCFPFRPVGAALRRVKGFVEQ